MLPELLVLFSCINNIGCQDVSNQYFRVNPEVRDILNRKEIEIKKELGPVVVHFIGPFLYASLGGVATIQLTSCFNVQITSQTGMIKFERNY